MAQSLLDTMDWFRTRLDDVAPTGRPVILVGSAETPRSPAA
jgi:phospholipase/carboxylesterase